MGRLSGKLDRAGRPFARTVYPLRRGSFRADRGSADALKGPIRFRSLVPGLSDLGSKDGRSVLFLAIGLGKLLDFGLGIGRQSVALLVTTTTAEENRLRVQIKLHPATGEQYLPEGIRLIWLSNTGQSREVTARSSDNYIQLPAFNTLPDKNFSIQVALGDDFIHLDFTT